MLARLETPRTHRRLADALVDSGEREALERALPLYLRSHRWFGGRARQLVGARVERWLELPGGACLCVVSATDADAVTTEHQLHLALHPEGQGRTVVDALALEAARAQLLRLALEGGRSGGSGLELVFEPTGVASPGCSGGGRLLEVEQSNSSLAYGEACVLKVYRRLERGPNPEVELSRYLTTETEFDALPRVYASGRLVGEGGYGADAVLVQEWAPNSGDGWAWALAAARRAFDAAGSGAQVRPWLETEGDTLRAAAALGETTARLHTALAAATSAGMRPEPVAAADVSAWRGEAAREASAAASVLAGTGAPVPPEFRALAEGAGLLHLPETGGLGLKTRVHGDYHLGQALRTDSGFVLTDFEGEPLRPLPERRRLQHPLTDVAGMLRSWQYAAATASEGSGEEPARAVAAEWEAAVRGRFLDAYLGEARRAGPRYLPEDPTAVVGLLRLFELRKALYEVRYELNNRPGWAWIPEAAARRLAGELSADGAR